MLSRARPFCHMHLIFFILESEHTARDDDLMGWQPLFLGLGTGMNPGPLKSSENSATERLQDPTLCLRCNFYLDIFWRVLSGPKICRIMSAPGFRPRYMPKIFPAVRQSKATVFNVGTGDVTNGYRPGPILGS
jgi:hypothetical protein